MDTVDVVVTCADGEYAIAAVNKDPVHPQEVALAILDGNPEQMRVHTVNGPSPDSYNDIDVAQVGVTVSEWTPFSGSVTLDPHSVNVIELR